MCLWAASLQIVYTMMWRLLEIQVEAALHSANMLLSTVSLIGEEPTLKEKVALMLQPAYILKGELPSPPPTPLQWTPRRLQANSEAPFASGKVEHTWGHWGVEVRQDRKPADW